MDNSNSLESGIRLAGRYEIIERIGAGGMSDVYVAKDHSLGRQVAVKILKPEFAEDKTFVSKFRAEAQAAAGLEHPNIVNIYDVGTEGSLYFIVMEYVEGITLKTYISKKGRLSYNEALSIAIQVGRGIEAAHNKGIIHRDIKPQNIIISKEGNVKVMDFGIARAASSNTINADLMGSVHYASPEQARNGFVTFTSDIYSLGIVMYEMVTGQVPYDGDTAVSIAIKHIQGEMTPPSAYAPDLPIAVERIIQKATMKSQDRRYQTMSDMLVDLKKALVNPNEDFVTIPDGSEANRTRVISEDELSQIQKEANRIDARDSRNATRPTPSRPADDEPDDEDEEDEDDDDGQVNPGMEKAMTIMGIAAAVVIAAIVIYILGSAFGLFGFKKNSTETPAETTEDVTTDSAIDEDANGIPVPDLLGMTPEEAKKALNDVGLGYEEGEAMASDRYDEGLVAEQSTNSGLKVEKNTTITVRLSSGKGDIDIPSVVGMDENAAINTLKDNGFQYNRTYAYSSDVAQGQVISQDPKAGGKGQKDQTISIVVSQGQEAVKVPIIEGMSQADAEAALAAVGLTAAVKTEYSDTVALGQVIKQNPSAGSFVDAGSAVSVTVSMGMETVLYTYSGTIEAQNGEDTTYVLVDLNGSPVDTWQVTAAEGSKNISANGISTETGTLEWTTATGTTGSMSVKFEKQ